MAMKVSAENKKQLIREFGKAVRFDEPMSLYTSFKIGGVADALVKPDEKKKLIELVQWCREFEVPYMVVGSGSNLLVKDGGIRGVVILLENCLNEISEVSGQDHNQGGVLVKAMAGVKLQRLCRYAVNEGLAGLNFATGIPGTVGGGIIMNAGTVHGCMENVVHKIAVLAPSGQVKNLTKEQLVFNYRKLDLRASIKNGTLHQPGVMEPIILDGEFNLIEKNSEELKQEANDMVKQRKASQPLGSNSCGCFFKNPDPEIFAGKLIDKAGLKGKQIGGAQVSTIHANYIVNRGDATASDVLQLMQHIQDTVREKFKIFLEPEVKIVGE